MITKKILTAFAAFFPILAALAQTPGASQQVDFDQQRRQLEQAASMMIATNAVPELYPGETGDLGPQSVLRLKPRRTLIEAGADLQYFYTDNIFLANQNQQGAAVLVSTVSAALAPTPYEFAGGRLAPRLGFQQQWWNYGLGSSAQVNVFDLSTLTTKSVGLDQFDFNVMTVFTDLAWSWQHWAFTLGGDYRQLNNAQSSDEFYKEYILRWAARRNLLTGEKTALSLGYEGDYRLTDTQNGPPNTGGDFNDRTDHSLVLAGSWRLCRHAILQPSYRFQYTHFTCARRDDFLHVFDLSLYCPITDNITFRTYVSYDNLKTDGYYVQSCEMMNTGGGVNFIVRF